MKVIRTRRRRAFTLVEMVMVVMIIGMISSMAIPRISKGATGAADATLAGDLNIVRKAILFYAAEHSGAFPGPTSGRFAAQLTQYSDATGQTSVTHTASYAYGPYLQALPACPVGPNAGNNKVLIDLLNSPPRADVSSGDGWIYNPNSGEFYANLSGTSQLGITLIAK